MPFDETRKCGNCLFRLVLEDQNPRCRFNAPVPRQVDGRYEDMIKYDVTRYPKCPGPACGQWQPEEEPEIIEPEVELPNIIQKDEE